MLNGDSVRQSLDRTSLVPKSLPIPACRRLSRGCRINLSHLGVDEEPFFAVSIGAARTHEGQA